MMIEQELTLELKKIAGEIDKHPYKSWLTGRFNTAAGSLVPYFKNPNWDNLRHEQAFVEVDWGSRILVEYDLQKEFKNCSTVLFVPGINGGSESTQALGIAHKATFRGMNVVRMNFPGQNGTDELAEDYHHPCQSNEIKDVMISSQDRGLRNFLVCGHSMGCQNASKFMGDLSETALAKSQEAELLSNIKAVALLSGCMDMRTFWNHFNKPHNAIFNAIMMDGLNGYYKLINKVLPGHFPIKDENGLNSVAQRMFERDPGAFPMREPKAKLLPEWLSWYVLGSMDPQDSIEEGQANCGMNKIHLVKTPTLLLNAKDDTIAPYYPSTWPQVRNNPNVLSVITNRGGHDGFISFDKKDMGWMNGVDAHWDQNLAVWFFEQFACSSNMAESTVLLRAVVNAIP